MVIESVKIVEEVEQWERMADEDVATDAAEATEAEKEKEFS